MKQKFNSILLHLPAHLAVKFGKYIKACLVKLSDLTTRWGGKCNKNDNYFGFTPPPSLEAYGLLYLQYVFLKFVRRKARHEPLLALAR
jgi:hypothetical protein